jgi:hypothetical protein
MAKYALITHHDEGYKALADLTWGQNKTEYAKVHGYDMHAKTSNWKSPVPDKPHLMTGFEKFHWAKEVLESHPEYDWIWWTGTDTMITNFGTRIEDRIFSSHHFIISVDVNGINDDSFLVRNSVEGRSFLDAILARQEEGLRFWDGGQRIINYLCGLPGTGEPGWPHGDALKVCDQYKDIVKLMPQRYMNSFNYLLYPQYQPPNDKFDRDGNWVLGDWLIHWPAVGTDGRIQLANFYKEHIVK